MSDSKSAEVATKKQMQRNVLWLSISFAFVYFGINTYKNFAVSLFGNAGSTCLGILYTMAAVCNFIIPAVLYFTKSEVGNLIASGIAMTWATNLVVLCSIFLLQFAYYSPTMATVFSFITGFFFAVSWSVQSILIAQNSIDENRGYNSNLFYGIFMVGNVFGNIFAYILLNVINIETSDYHPGWNGGMSFLFIGLSVSALIGSCLMMFIRSPSSSKSISNTPKKAKTITDTSSSAEKSTVWKDIGQKVIAVIRCMVRNHMPLLLLLFVNNGYAQVIVSTQVARQIPSVKLVGLVMAVFSVTEVVVSLGLTPIADKAGHRLMGLIGVLAEIIACVATCIMNEKQGGWVYVPPVLFAIMDTIYQTECMSLIGRYFSDELEDAAATYRLVQGIGSSICSFVTPLFVSSGASASTLRQLVVEMAIAAAISILGYLLLLVFLSLRKKV